MRLALFKNMNYSFSSPHPSSEHLEGDRDYARVSEYVEVEFKPLTDEAAIKQQIDALDRTERELRNQFQSKLNGIEQRRAELRAITYVPAASARRDPDEAFDGGRLG